ncbi:MAG: DUF4242 domain-containing protein [Actinomycetota bacterium]|nr:DUF4242 domain-containing protein [Actinomycetota bacterium]
MPVFMIERQFAEELESVDAVGLKQINDEASVQWLYSFLSKDKRKTYCLYEAESADAIRAAAQRAGIPADVIVEVSQTIQPDGTYTSVQTSP